MKVKKIKSVLFLIILIFAIFCILSDNVLAYEWIDINSPSSGSTYYEGQSLTISWSYSTNSGEWVQIELYRSGNYYTTITSNTTNNGFYTWTIPGGYGTNYYYYQIRIISKTDPYVDNFSPSFYIYSKSISINYPSSGVIWYPDETYTISWSSENVGGYVRIELYKSGSYVSTITSYASDYGSFSWAVTSSLLKSSYYQIKISSTSDSSVYDFSDYFSINPRSISITSPSGGETLYTGETFNIKWTSESAGSYVSIYYLYGTSSYGYTIASYVSNSESYSWTIPRTMSTGSNYRIKIESYTYPSVYDISSYFTIDERYIDIISPSYASKWYPNETHSISWSSKNAGSKVDIKLYKNDVYCASIASNIENSGSYSWSINDFFAPDSNYQIEIRSNSITSVYALSETFSIGDRTITITSPTNGETLYKGETITIQWTSENAGNYLSIELYKDDAKYATIEEYAPNQGYYDWQVPNDLSIGSTYQIRIISPLYGNAEGLSSGYITIEETFFQKLTSPLVFIIAIIVAAIILYVVYAKYLKTRIKKSKEEQHQIQKDQPIQPIIQRPVNPEEYENIWEKK